MAAIKKPNVLLVDDEFEIIEVFGSLLEEDFQVELASSAEQALEVFEKKRFDVIVTDLKMPGISGLDLAKTIIDRRPEAEIIVMTAYPDIDSAIELIRIGAVELLRKPFQWKELKIAIERALIQKRARASAIEVKVPEGKSIHSVELEGMGKLIGQSVAMKRLRSKVSRIQYANTTVLITGKTGSGKEVLARAIHELSLIHI